MLRALFWTPAVLVFLVVAGAVGFFAAPEIRVPSPLLTWAMDRFPSRQVRLTSNDVEVRLMRPQGRFFDKVVQVEAKDSCVDYSGEFIRVCAQRLSLRIRVGWSDDARSWWRPVIKEIQSLRLKGGEVAADLSALGSHGTALETFEERFERALDLVEALRRGVLDKWNVQESEIEISSLLIKTKDERRFQGRFRLSPLSSEPHAMQIALEEFREVGGPLRARVQALLRFPPEGAPLWRLEVDSLLSLGRGRRIILSAGATAVDSQEIDFELRGKLKGVSILRRVALNARLRSSRLDGALSVGTDPGEVGLKRFEVKNCGLRADLRQLQGALDCDSNQIVMVIRRTGGEVRIAPRFGLHVNRVVWGETKSAEIEADFHIERPRSIRATTRIKGELARSRGGVLRYSFMGGAEVAVASFADLVELASRTPYAVPAPLNVLKGTASLQADFKIVTGKIDAAYRVTTKLDGRGEAADLRVAGTTKAQWGDSRWSGETEASIVVDRLWLTAPRIDLAKPPRLTPDRRFGPLDERPRRTDLSAQTPSASGTPKMRLYLRVKTARPGAILITSNLAKSPLPLEVDLTYDNVEKQTIGVLTVGETPLEIFRRNAVLDFLKVKLTREGQGQLQGLARVNDLEYRISIHLEGTVREPRLRFASDPPLPDDQILAVLLFARPMEELATEQRGSVANVRAAFADAALGLSSLFLLANTPVESVGYDVERELVTVNVGLGGGAAIQLGARPGEKGNSIGFRKRLSPHLIFRTDFESLGDSDKKIMSALLEWSKRF